jgi:hypothetical protein
VASLNLGFTIIGIIPAWFVVRNIGILADGTRIYKPAMYATKDEREELDGKGVEQVAAKTKTGQNVSIDAIGS